MLSRLFPSFLPMLIASLMALPCVATAQTPASTAPASAAAKPVAAAPITPGSKAVPENLALPGLDRVDVNGEAASEIQPISRNPVSARRQTPEADDVAPPTRAKPDNVIQGQPEELPPLSESAHEAAQRLPWIAVIYELDKTDTNNAFISNAVNGAHQAHEEMRTPFFERRITSPDEREKVLREAAQKYKLVIAIGYQLVPTIITLAEKYPETRFTLIDGMVPPLFNNVQSIVFKDHEGAFLVGMLAAYASRTKNVGFIGGMDVPVIRNFAIGYQQGVNFVDPSIQIQNAMVGSPTASSDAWNSPDQAEKIARNMYRSGADVIFAAAGTSGVGVMRAAKALNELAIGVDSNQNYLFPGTVLTSMVKRVDRAVYDTIRGAKEGEWQPGIKYMGIKEEALDYSVDRNNRSLITQQMLDSLENAKDMIIRGSKTVESYQP